MYAIIKCSFYFTIIHLFLALSKADKEYLCVFKSLLDSIALIDL